jgi:hypothetical protein
MSTKKTIGINPLEAYLAARDEPELVVHTKAEEVVPATPSGKKERITIHLPIDLIGKIKNAVYWEPGLTLTAFAEYAFERALHEQEEKRGAPYPERSGRTLKGGRPVL